MKTGLSFGALVKRLLPVHTPSGAFESVGPSDPSADVTFEMTYSGYCPICAAPAVFQAKNQWLRDSLLCQSCENGSVPRERALAHVLNRHRPNWRDLSVHESSPANRGISARLKRECKDYIGSHYHPDKPLGKMVDGLRNENLEQQTFDDGVVDIVITLDVFEHVWRPDLVMKEIFRTLRPGGVYIATFPIRKHQVESHRARNTRDAQGNIAHFEPQEMHDDPTSGQGALVTFDYGYKVHQQLARWAPFSVEVSRFADHRLGIIGEYTEVVICEKPALDPAPSSQDRST